MRRRKRRVIAYLLCVAIFGGAVLLALRLSHPVDRRQGQVRHAGRTGAEVKVATENELLRVRVGKDEYEYRLLQTERGLAAEEVRRGKR